MFYSGEVVEEAGHSGVNGHHVVHLVAAEQRREDGRVKILSGMGFLLYFV